MAAGGYRRAPAAPLNPRCRGVVQPAQVENLLARRRLAVTFHQAIIGLALAPRQPSRPVAIGFRATRVLLG